MKLSIHPKYAMKVYTNCDLDQYAQRKFLTKKLDGVATIMNSMDKKRPLGIVKMAIPKNLNIFALSTAGSG
jgi:hypothetical protein